MAKGSTTATRGPTTAADFKPDDGAALVADEIEKGGGDLDLDLEDRGEGDNGLDQRRAAPRLDDDDDRDRKPASLKYEDDPRAALSKSFAKERAVEGRELKPDYEEDAEDEAEEADESADTDPEVKIVAGPGAREVNQPQTQAPERRVRTDLQPDDLVVIKVDGADVQMTYAEMQALAQKNAAADNRLRDANAIVDEVRSIEARIKNSVAAPADTRHPDGGQAPQPAARPAPSGQTTIDKARVIKVVDEIQTGTPEAGAEALTTLITDAVQAAVGQTKAPDVRSVVRQTIDADQVDRSAATRVGEAYLTVKDTFGDVLDDDNPRLANMAFEDSIGGVIAALKKAGTPDEDFAAIAKQAADRGETFGLVLMRKYATLQANPEYGLPAVSDIFINAAKGVRKWRTGDENVPVNAKGKPIQAPTNGGGKQPSADNRARIVVSSERRERKVGMNVQPRSASMRTDHTSRAMTRKDASKTVAEMAATRK